MKSFSKIAICIFTATVSLSVLADEVDTVMDREKTLEAMRFKRDQLKLQGDMSESWKKMTDSGVIVDQEGIPLGVKSIVEMAIEVRKQGKTPADGNPFDSGAPPLAPNGLPFMSEQQAMMPPSQGLQTPQPPFGGRHQPAPPVPTEKESKPPVEEEKQNLDLVKVEAASVTVLTNDGEHVVRVGEKVYDMTLTKFSVDKAYFKGPKGLRVISINWNSSK
jgi:hypothetical protein